MDSQIISTAIAAGALAISILVYFRHKSIDNENFFFQYKIEQYAQLINVSSELLELLHQSFVDVLDEMENTFPDNDEIDEIVNEIDEKMCEFRIVLQKSCAFVPKEIVERLDKLYDAIFEVQRIYEKQLKKSNLESGMDKIGELEDDLQEIINLMRKDLGIESINLRLKKRTA